jgi:hypothetical protein
MIIALTISQKIENKKIKNEPNGFFYLNVFQKFETQVYITSS